MAKGTNDLVDFRINFENKDLKDFWFREPGVTGYHGSYILEECKLDQSRIELVDPAKNQQEEGGIEATTIRFTVDKESCKDPFSEGCDIKFASGTNLKWKDNFQPKLIYSKS